MRDKNTSTTCDLGACKEIYIDGFDGDDRAVLVIAVKKPLIINGHKRDFAGIVLGQKELASLAAQLMKIAKRKRRSSSIIMPSAGQLVRPVRAR